jgi:peroxiredoxin
VSLVGKSAPPLVNLYDTDKKLFDGASLAGKKTIVAFIPGAFTGVCTKEMCTFRDSLAGLNSAGAQVLAVDVDAPFSNAAFAQKNNLNFPVLSDYTHATIDAWGVRMEGLGGLPGYVSAKRAVFIIGPDGTVSYEWVAPNPGVEPDYEAVKAAV